VTDICKRENKSWRYAGGWSTGLANKLLTIHGAAQRWLQRPTCRL